MTLQPLLPAPGTAAAVPADVATDGLASGAAFGAALAALVASAIAAPGSGPDGDSAGVDAVATPGGQEAPSASDLAVLAQLAGLTQAPAPVQGAGPSSTALPGHPGQDTPVATAPGTNASATAATTAPPPAPSTPADAGDGPGGTGPDAPQAPITGPVVGRGELLRPTGAAGTPAPPDGTGGHGAGTPDPGPVAGAVALATAAGHAVPAPGGRGETTRGEPAPDAAALATVISATADADPRDGTGAARRADDEAAAPAAPSTGGAGTTATAAVGPGTNGVGGVTEAGTPGDARSTDRPAAAAVPDQVLRHLTAVRALRDGGHRTVLRLDPEHLGEVTLTLDVRGGAVRLAVSGGAEALEALRSGLGDLRSSLAEAGLALDDVRLRPETATGTAGTGPGTDDDARGRTAGEDAGSTGGPGTGAGRDGRAGGSAGEGGRDGRATEPWRPDLVPRAGRAAHRGDEAETGSSLDVRV